VVGHTHGDLAGLEEQGSFDEQGALIMQEVLPPVGGNELREDHREVAALALGFHPIDVIQEGRRMER